MLLKLYINNHDIKKSIPISTSPYTMALTIGMDKIIIAKKIHPV